MKKKNLTETAKQRNDCYRIGSTDNWSEQEAFHPRPSVIENKLCHYSAECSRDSHSGHSQNANLENRKL